MYVGLRAVWPVYKIFVRHMYTETGLPSSLIVSAFVL